MLLREQVCYNELKSGVPGIELGPDWFLCVKKQGQQWLFQLWDLLSRQSLTSWVSLKKIENLRTSKKAAFLHRMIVSEFPENRQQIMEWILIEITDHESAFVVEEKEEEEKEFTEPGFIFEEPIKIPITNENNKPDYNIIDVSKLRWIHSITPIADKIVYNRETQMPEPLYSFWRLKWSRLDRSLSILITPPELSMSSRALYIEPMPYKMLSKISPPAGEKLWEWAKKLEIKTREEQGRRRSRMAVWDDVIELQDTLCSTIQNGEGRLVKPPIFWHLIRPIELETVAKIASWDFHVLIADYLTEGLTKDKKLVYFFRAKIPKILRSIPQDDVKLQRFSSQSAHGFVVSPTKAGKTFTSKKITGRFHFRALSDARALGYSTADETHSGELDGLVGGIGVDDIHKSEYRMGGLAGLLNIMEDGQALTGKGQAAVFTRCAASMSFYANMTPEDTAVEMINDFTELVGKFTPIPGTLGSRLGIILFDPKMEAVTDPEKTGVIEEENGEESESWVGINQVVVDYIRNSAQPNMEKIWFNVDVQRWLTQSIPWYVDAIANQVKKAGSILDAKIRSFWVDHAERGFRHVRGFALRQALVDHMKAIWRGDYEIKDIIEDADMHLSKVCLEIMVNSLKKMIVASKELDWGEILKDKFTSIRPVYLKGLILAAGFKLGNLPNEITGKTVKINDLNEYHALSKEKKEEHGLKGYPEIAKVHNKLSTRKKGFGKFNIYVLEAFGIQIMRGVDGLSVKFMEQADRLPQLLKKLNISPVSPISPIYTFQNNEKKARETEAKIHTTLKDETGENREIGEMFEWKEFHAVGPMATPEKSWKKTVAAVNSFKKDEARLPNELELKEPLKLYWTEESIPKVLEKLRQKQLLSLREIGETLSIKDVKAVHWDNEFYDKHECCVCGYDKMTSWQAETFKGEKRWICDDCKLEWDKLARAS